MQDRNSYNEKNCEIISSINNITYQCMILKNAEKLCAKNRCDNKMKLACGRCRIQSYCSKDCQKDMWPLHKKFCNEILAHKKCSFSNCFDEVD